MFGARARVEGRGRRGRDGPIWRQVAHAVAMATSRARRLAFPGSGSSCLNPGCLPPAHRDARELNFGESDISFLKFVLGVKLHFRIFLAMKPRPHFRGSEISIRNSGGSRADADVSVLISSTLCIQNTGILKLCLPPMDSCFCLYDFYYSRGVPFVLTFFLFIVYNEKMFCFQTPNPATNFADIF